MRHDRSTFARRLLLPLLIVASLISAGRYAPAAAEAPKALGTFKKWQALTVETDGSHSCYTISEPTNRPGNVKGRGKSAAMVTHFPQIGALDQVSIVLGFLPMAKSSVIVKIGGFTFKFTELERERAWVKNRSDDKALVQAMRKSNQMVVSATTEKGLKVEDTYSLSGFTKAYQAMSKACSS